MELEITEDMRKELDNEWLEIMEEMVLEGVMTKESE